MRNKGSKHRTIVMLALFLATVLYCEAQNGQCRRTIVYVSPLDAKGHSLPDLKADQITAKFKGKPANVLSLKRDSRPMRLLIFLDASGSMLSQREVWVLGLRMVESFVTAADANQPVSLIVFSKSVLKRVDSTGKSEEIKNALLQIAPGAKALPGARLTAIYDTVLAELPKAQNPAMRDLVLVVTDGMDTSSRTRMRDFEDILIERRMAISAILIDPFTGTRGRTPEELAGPPELANLIAATGGIVAQLSDGSNKRQVAEDVNRIASAMNLTFQVELELQTPVDRGGKLKLDFVNQPSKQAERNLLASPRRLRGCTVP